MSYHERRLPHYYPPEAILFLTWRLFGSLPAFSSPSGTDPGKVFAQHDLLLDTATSGPRWLKDQRIAALVAKGSIRVKTNTTYTSDLRGS